MNVRDFALIDILEKIHNEKGLDFSQYKEKSIKRRIDSRLKRYNLESYKDYIRLLEQSPDEYNELVKVLTINVTEYFRNPESFSAIENIVVPRVIYSKREHQHRIIRAWSCGCSSGDEAYSLAILLLEKLGNARDRFTLTIVGSDIDRDVLEESKTMVYTKERLKAVSKNLVNKYFDKIDNDHYKLKQMVRDMVRLRYHDIVKEKPFPHCDIILCRNLLIYFNKKLQEETLVKFYSSLNPGGFLVLGMTESLYGEAANLFSVVNSRLRIYTRSKPSADIKQESILSQDQIDKIVKEMLG